MTDHCSLTRRRAFTLIELIVVMTLMAVMFALVAPQMSNFLHGRNTVEECRRLLALTRFARSTAIGRGEKMELWLVPGSGQYGLRTEVTGTGQPQPLQFQLAENLAIQAPKESLNKQGEAVILFWPDGTIDEDSPQELTLTENGQEQYRIVLADNRMEYTAEDPAHAQ